MLDLFISKKTQIYEFIQGKGRVRTHEVIAYGLSLFTNRGDRYARDLAEEGKIWRMNDTIKLILFGKTKEDVWSIYESDREKKEATNV